MTDPSPVLVQLLTDDIRAAVSRQMLPPAALADVLIRRGWRPVVDNSTHFMGAGDREPDYSAERGPASTPEGAGRG